MAEGGSSPPADFTTINLGTHALKMREGAIIKNRHHHNPEDDWESIDPAFIAALTECAPAILFVLAFIGAIITH